MRPKGASSGQIVWQSIQSIPVWRAKLGTARASLVHEVKITAATQRITTHPLYLRPAIPTPPEVVRLIYNQSFPCLALLFSKRCSGAFNSGLELLFHISDHCVNLARAQGKGRHGAVTVFNGCSKMILYIALPKAGIRKIIRWRAERFTRRPVARPIFAVTHGTRVIKDFLALRQCNRRIPRYAIYQENCDYEPVNAPCHRGHSS